MVLVAAPMLDLAAQQPLGRPDARQRDRMAQGQRLEGQAMLALADAAMAGKRAAAPSDLRIRWQNAFLKAQQGTFVPFTLAIEAAGSPPAAALVYIRAVVKPPASGSSLPPASRPVPPRRGSRKPLDPGYPVDAIFPVELEPAGSRMATVSRGFSIEPGEYDVYVVVRERLGSAPRPGPRTGVLMQTLSVPDYRSGGLAASSAMLADRLSILPGPLTDDELVERPYVIGQHEITPAADDRFRRNEELVVVLLVYDPTVTAEKHFDVEVEYHFYKRIGSGPATPAPPASAPHPPEQAGEQYFNHTDPQRFNRAMMGPQYDPSSGHPVLAGQGIPLAGFELGNYRLAIRVTDRLSGKIVTRDLSFTVES
jgi:hypothetical protein